MKKIVLTSVVLSVMISIVANLAVNQIMTNQNSILDGATQKHVLKIEAHDYYGTQDNYMYAVFLDDVLGYGHFPLGTYWIQADDGEIIYYATFSGVAYVSGAPYVSTNWLETSKHEYLTVGLVYADTIIWSERAKVEYVEEFSW